MGCGSPAETKCSVCLKHGVHLYYCSKACQQSDWKAHKKICGPKYVDAVIALSIPISINDADFSWGLFGSLESVVRAFINDRAKDIDMAIDPETGLNWLHLASKKGSEEAARALIAAGADVNKATICDEGDTPLRLAAQNGQEPVVRALVAAGADVNKATTSGLTPLNTAVCVNHAAVIRALIAAGADSNSGEERTLGTPLCAAAFMGLEEAARALIAAGADVNKATTMPTSRCMTPLFAAGFDNRAQMVRLLIAAGADINYATDDGETTLCYAVSVGFEATARVLIDAVAAKRRVL